MNGRNKLIVKAPKIVDDHSVYCDFTYSTGINMFFKVNTFFVEYNSKINNVPRSILIIPFLSNICPIAWASDTDIYLEEIDKEFLESLKLIKDSFQKMYPNLKLSGDIYVDKIIESKGYSRKNSAVLFSGGVDSLTTFIRTRNENPYLITIWGADIRLHQYDAWKKVKLQITEFGRKYRVGNLFIKSNFRTFIDYTMLNKAYAKYVVSWWGGVQHGLGLLGLCAPLTFSEGISTIYNAATRTETEPFFIPWGSHPSIDNHVKWGETETIHDGYELTRQDKLGVISKYIKSIDSKLQLRVCYSSNTGGNCCQCEKCCRTVVGLLLEDINPNEHGFNINKNIFEYIQVQFEQGKWKLTNGGSRFIWEDIKRNAVVKAYNIKSSEARDFFMWLQKINFYLYQNK